VTFNDLEWLFRVKFCFHDGMSSGERSTFENVKTNKDRPILSAMQIFGKESSFWQYKVCADIRVGSLEKR